jgi:Peptidase M15
VTTAAKKRPPRRSAAQRRLPSELTGKERGVDFYVAGEGWKYRDKTGRVHQRYSPEGEYARAQDRGEAGESFSATRVLRRAGAGTRSAGRSYARAGSFLARSAEVEPISWGRLLLWAGASIIGLALLDAMLSGRGPAGVDKLSGLASSGIGKLLDPHDPLIGHGAPAPPTQLAEAAVTSAGVGIPGSGSAVAQLDPFKTPAAKAATSVFGSPLATLPRTATQGGRTIELDSRVVDQATAIVNHFGVRVSSGYRDPAHNAEVGGAKNSDHLSGDAADFVGTPAQITRLYAWAVKQGFPYVEPLSQAKDHVHISFLRGGKA